MEEYPEEFRTPPLPLAALIGLPELHLQVTHYLRAQQPPLATVSISDAAGAGILAGKERRPPDARLPPPLGFFKAGWLAKHRQRAASVAVAFFPREKVFGDPGQWLSVCTQIDAIKAAVRGRNIKVVIAVAQAGSAALDISDERILALRKRVETEARFCVSFVTGDVSQLRNSLSNLAKLVGELAANYYRDEGRRIKTRIEKKAYSSFELSVRYNFKIAVYAEFRRDWVSAVKYYNAAYTLLHEVPTPPQELQPVQRLVEAKSVAEILHLKLVTLLLHSGNTSEAITQLRRHMSWYRLREGPPEGSFLHWAWVSKQYKVFGELLQSRLAIVSEKSPGAVSGVLAAVNQTGSEREQLPAFYFQAAALCAIKRRQAFEAALSIAQTFGDLEQEDVLAGDADKLGPPLYIGQAPRILARGLTPETQRPTEAEFVWHALLQERQVAHSQLAIALLTRAHDEYKRMPHAGRIIYQLGGEMADEYLHANDLSNARRLYDSVAALYRRESWTLPLSATLGRLRECALKMRLVPDFVEYSLELASLPLDADEVRRSAQRDAMAVLSGKGLPLESGLEDSPRPESALSVDPASPLVLSVMEASPLRTAVSCAALFEQRSAQPGQPVKLTVALLSRLPETLNPSCLEISLSDPLCNVTLSNTAAQINLMDDEAPKTTQGPVNLTLNPLDWWRFTVEVTPSVSGRLECQAVSLTLGPNAHLRCHVDSLVGGEILVPFWMYEPLSGGSPFTQNSLGGLGVLEVGEAQADVDVGVEFAGAPGLVSEVLPMRVKITSKGDKVSKGRLDLELEGLTPKPASAEPSPLLDLGSEASYTEELPAELLTQAGYEDGALNEKGYEPFMGRLAVPDIDAGGSWEAVLFVRWTQAADAGLALTLSYDAEKEGAPERKAKVRKVVPMRGEQPFSVTHRWIAPFRKDALLPAPSTASAKLPINEDVLLSVSVRSSSSVPILVKAVSLNLDANVAEEVGKGTSLLGASETKGEARTVRPGEAFSRLFRVRPRQADDPLALGSIAMTWQRHEEMPRGSWAREKAHVVSGFQLSPVSVESPSLVVKTQLSAHALLGVPFAVTVDVTNGTELLQEVTYSVTDAPSFVLGGSHNGHMSILPQSTKSLTYRVVAIQAGLVALPQVRFTAVRQNAKLNPTAANARIFVYPTLQQADRDGGSQAVTIAAG